MRDRSANRAFLHPNATSRPRRAAVGRQRPQFPLFTRRTAGAGTAQSRSPATAEAAAFGSTRVQGQGLYRVSSIRGVCARRSGHTTLWSWVVLQSISGTSTGSVWPSPVHLQPSPGPKTWLAHGVFLVSPWPGSNELGATVSLGLALSFRDSASELLSVRLHPKVSPLVELPS